MIAWGRFFEWRELGLRVWLSIPNKFIGFALVLVPGCEVPCSAGLPFVQSKEFFGGELVCSNH